MLTAFQDFLYNCAISFDLPVLDWIQATLQSDFMDKFMPFITKFGDHGTFWMIVAALLFVFPKSCFPSLLQAVLGHLPAAAGINQWDAGGRRLLRHDC